MGAFLLVRALQAWKKPVAAAQVDAQPAAAPADDYIARLEEEVRRKK